MPIWRASARPCLWLPLGQIIATVPIRVVLDGLPLQMVQRQSHRSERGNRDNRGPLHPIGLMDRPIQGLHAPDRTAQDQPEPPNAKRIQQLCLSPDVIPDRNQGKIRSVDEPGLRVHRARPGRAVAGPQQVDADDKIVLKRQNRTGRKDLRPPRAHQSRPRERMAHKHRVVAGSIQPSVHGVVQRRFRQNAPALQQRGARGAQSRLRRSAPARSRRARVRFGHRS